MSCRLALIIALIFTTLTGGFASAQAPPTFSPPERAVVVQALKGTPEAAVADTSDLALWSALIAYAERETGQRLRAKELDRTWALQGPARNLDKELRAAHEEGRLAAAIASLPPQSPRFRALLAERARYARIVAAGGWAPMPSGAVLRPDAQDPRLPALRDRLIAEGYLPTSALTATRYDTRLQAAVVDFQRRHGLVDDGKISTETLAALNMTAERRLAQIDANLERWRWQPAVLPGDRIEVDIGRAQAMLVQGDLTTLQMRIIVGDLKHKTPLFASRLEAVIFNPPWRVPDSIAKAELLPKAARNPGYLAANDFVFDNGRLVQKPGPKNALGQIKFDLPSPFGVYLHDTPAKSLFARRMRALSHGCMRLEKPKELAVQLLAGQGWTPEQIDAAIAAKATKQVNLVKPIPLFVNYFTAFTDARGLVNFVPDSYGWDDDLIAAMNRLSR